MPKLKEMAGSSSWVEFEMLHVSIELIRKKPGGPNQRSTCSLCLIELTLEPVLVLWKGPTSRAIAL